MRSLILITFSLATFAVFSIASYDALVEVNAEIPKRVDVTIDKMFSCVQLSNDLYERDTVYPEGIFVSIKSNLAGPFEVILFSPKKNGFYLHLDGNPLIPFYLVQSGVGRKLFSGDVLYSRGKKSLPDRVELMFDLVIPRQDKSVPLFSNLSGHIGVNIQDV